MGEYTFVTWNMRGISPYVYAEKINYLLNVQKTHPHCRTFAALQEMGDIRNCYIDQRGNVSEKGPCLTFVEQRYKNIRFDRPDKPEIDRAGNVLKGRLSFTLNGSPYKLVMFQPLRDKSRRLTYGLAYPRKFDNVVVPVNIPSCPPLLALYASDDTAVCCFYAPASKSDGIAAVKNAVETLRNKRFVVCGDFNCESDDLASIVPAVGRWLPNRKQGAQSKKDGFSSDGYARRRNGFLVCEEIAAANKRIDVAAYTANFVDFELYRANMRICNALREPNFQRLTPEQKETVFGTLHGRPINEAAAEAISEFVSYLSDRYAVSATVNIPNWD